MDPEPRFRRAVYGRGSRRNSGAVGGWAEIRRLLHSASEFLHGSLDQGFGLVSKLPAAAILSQGYNALHTNHSRGGRDAKRPIHRKASERTGAISVSKLRGSSCKGQSLLDRRRSNAGPQAGFHVDRLGTRDVGLHQALRVQVRLSRWLGRLRHCVWKLRRHLLPLCEALRRNQSLAAAHRRTAAEARAPGDEMMTTSGSRRHADPIAATKRLGICPAALW